MVKDTDRPRVLSNVPRNKYDAGVTVENIPPQNYTPSMFWHMIVGQIIPPLWMTGVQKRNF